MLVVGVCVCVCLCVHARVSMFVYIQCVCVCLCVCVCVSSVRWWSEGTGPPDACVSMQITAGSLWGVEEEHGVAELIYLMTERLISPEP